MPTRCFVSCWLLALGGGTALAQTAPAQHTPTGQTITEVLPVNPFPRANSVWLQPTDPVPVAMNRLVRYYQARGYVVDTVDREVFFTVQAHTLLQLPQRPVRLDVRASFGGSPVTVCLRATYATGPVRRVRAFPRSQPELLPTPRRHRQVRYATFLAPARRAAFLELQRVSREAFPGALLTYGNSVH